MSSIITAIGTANPEYRFPQMKIFEFMETAHQLNEQDSRRLKKIYEASGIEQRFSAIQDFGVPRGTYSFFGNYDNLEPFPDTKTRSNFYKERAKELSLEAIKDLQHSADINLLNTTHIITVSCTGMYAPGLDIDVIQMLGLPGNVERTCINFMGCYGAFNALKTAHYICKAEPASQVLIVDTELCTLHFQRENTVENWVANSLFADGSAAVVVQHENCGKRGLKAGSFFNTLLCEARDEMAWGIGNYGFEMKLSSSIAKNIGRNIAGVANHLRRKAGLEPESIGHLAIHPGGRRILEVCEDALGLPEEALHTSYDVLRQFGNMSSVTILFILKRFFAEMEQGEKLMAFAFGPGLTVESMLLEMT